MSENSRNAGSIVNGAARGLQKIVRSTARATKRTARIAKLKLDIKAENDNIKRLYTDIGRLYYEAHQDDPEGFFVQLFQQVDTSMDKIRGMETELEILRPDSTTEDAPFAPADDVPQDDITVEIEEEPSAGEDEPPAVEEEGSDEDDGVIEVEIKTEGE